MRVLLAGATGAVGKRLVPMLVAAGHHVIAATRTAAKSKDLRNAGAEVVVVDLLDRDAVRQAVVSARPEAIVHQATSLANMRSLKNFDAEFAMTNRLRVEGTEHLLAGARAAGTQRFIAQSYTGWPNERTGSRVKTEAEPFDPDPPAPMRRTLDAIRRLEEMVLDAAELTGIVLRYGSFYGPGTSVAIGGDTLEAVRQRKVPVIGGGGGVWSWLHIDDCARATKLAMEGGPAGVYNIVDDDPAEVSAWLPGLAQAIGAKPPRHLPAWLGRFFIGEAGVSMMTRIRGSSNAKAKRTFGWQPAYASWRNGFRHGLDEVSQATGLPQRVR